MSSKRNAEKGEEATNLPRKCRGVLPQNSYRTTRQYIRGSIHDLYPRQGHLQTAKKGTKPKVSKP